MSDQEIEIGDEIDVEEIMQQIREQILAQKSFAAGEGQLPLNIRGRRFSPEFYEHLYQAGMTYDQLQVKINVTQSRVPIIGPILDKLRFKIHELVVFYVNQIAERQMKINRHLLGALSLLGEELDEMLTAEAAASKSETAE